MRRMFGVAAGLVLLLGLFFASFILVGETGEVVVLHSSDAAGHTRETRLWVVDAEGASWLRSGSSARGWAERVVEQPAVTLVRSGERQRYVARPVRDTETRTMVDRLMREKYGLADRWATAFRTDLPVPFRLDPPERNGPVD